MSASRIPKAILDKIGIQDTQTLGKAEEFLRILGGKSSVKTISDYAKIVICIDLASSFSGIGFDKAAALKLTGLKKGPYQNNLNNIKKVLDLDKLITVSELCVQLSCTVIRDIAELILNNYKESQGHLKDIDHPQYIAVAVFTACKIRNIKVDKSQLKVVSRLKSSQWNVLIEEFHKFAASIGLKSTNKRGKCKGEDVKDITNDDKGTTYELVVKEKEDDEPEIEKYEDWRERILRAATAEILAEI